MAVPGGPGFPEKGIEVPGQDLAWNA